MESRQEAKSKKTPVGGADATEVAGRSIPELMIREYKPVVK